MKPWEKYFYVFFAGWFCGMGSLVLFTTPLAKIKINLLELVHGIFG